MCYLTLFFPFFKSNSNKISSSDTIIQYLKQQNHQMNIDLDSEKIFEDKKVLKQFQPDQKIVLSTKLIKINHVNKKQLRILVITNKNIYNLLPEKTIIRNRIKRKISYGNVVSLSVSRFGHQFVINVEKEHDYRFASNTLKTKIVETIVAQYCAFFPKKKKIALYEYDDLTLQNFTTTITDLQKKKKKQHIVEPIYVDSQSIKDSGKDKGDTKMIYKKKQAKQQVVKGFEQFQLLKVLGRGAFGKVMLCQNINNKKYYAVKSMRKFDLIEKESLEKAKVQKELLETVEHPFLVSLEFAFQTKQKIFFIMNFIKGGDMFSHVRRQEKFSENRAKFYAAQIFLGIQYLHKKGYVYRDLKPQNILFDIDGYLKISDFGLAKFLNPKQKTYSLVGTPDYVSPEVILSKGHSFPTDWWSLGIIIFQMLYGSPPYYNRDQQKMFHDILNSSVPFNAKIETTPEAKNIINLLLKKNWKQRLGTKGTEEIRQHPWFADIDFDKLYRKQYIPQFYPTVSSDLDVNNFDEQFTSEDPVNSLVTSDAFILSKFEQQFNDMGFANEGNDSSGKNLGFYRKRQMTD